MHSYAGDHFIEWPQDDAYRTHVDLHWLDVLSVFIADITAFDDVIVRRCFCVVRI